MQGCKRKGCGCLFVFLWLMAMMLTVETVQRTVSRQRERRAESYGAQRMAASQQAFSELEKALVGAPPVLGVDSRHHDLFAALDDKERLALARQRKELILVCDRNGIVLSTYAAQEPKEIAALASLAHVGEPLFRILPAEQAGDAQEAIRTVFATGQQVPREYLISLSDDVDYASEFLFFPMKDAHGVTATVSVFVQDSIWEIPWFKFRKSIHRNDAYDFRTNTAGFRDDEVVIPKPPGLYRIVCIGGSTTAEGPTNELTYPKILQRKFRDYFGTDQIEVVNCGIFALDSSGERQWLPGYLALEPDLIVHYNFVNDLTARLTKWMEPANPFTEPVKTLKLILRHSDFVYHHCNTWLLPPRAELSEHIESGAMANLRAISEAAAEAGVSMAVCSFAHPDVAYLSQDELDFFDARINTMLWGRAVDFKGYAGLVDLYNAQVREFCRTGHALYVPVAEKLNHGIEYYTDICHVNIIGTEHKAEIIFQALKEYVGERLHPPATDAPSGPAGTE